MPLEFYPDKEEFPERRHKKRRSSDGGVSKEDLAKIKRHIMEFDGMKSEISYIKGMMKDNNDSIISQKSDIDYMRVEVHEIKEIVKGDHETLLLRTSKFEQIPIIGSKVDKLCNKISIWSGGLAVISAIGIVFIVHIMDMVKRLG